MLDEYAALTAAAGFVDVSSRTRIELLGSDRAKFLHNMCTNDVKKLAVGGGCEAFLTDSQGRTLAHVSIYCLRESLLLETVPDEAEKIVKHLDRYIIREDVQLVDRGAEWGELLIAGAKADDFVGRLGIMLPSESRLACGESRLDDRAIRVARVEFAPSGILLFCDASQTDLLKSRLGTAGLIECGEAALEVLRIEAGFPRFGPDIHERTLPQEVARDSLAISFTKGCYIGQETVARIDALGHVNKTLVGLAFAGSDVPPPGTPLTAGEQAVGQVTSACFSPKLGGPLALAYVRRGSNSVGTEFASPFGAATVVALPV